MPTTTINAVRPNGIRDMRPALLEVDRTERPERSPSRAGSCQGDGAHLVCFEYQSDFRAHH
jgi:hypothetical protein